MGHLQRVGLYRQTKGRDENEEEGLTMVDLCLKDGIRSPLAEIRPTLLKRKPERVKTHLRLGLSSWTSTHLGP